MVGSSITSSDGLEGRARARASRAPPRRRRARAGVRGAHCSAPTRSSAANARARAADWGTPRASWATISSSSTLPPFASPRGALAVADPAAERVRRCRPDRARRSARRRVSGRSMPAATRSSVERPERRRPQTATSSPASSSKRHIAQHDALVRVPAGGAGRRARARAGSSPAGVPRGEALVSSRRAYSIQASLAPTARRSSSPTSRAASWQVPSAEV